MRVRAKDELTEAERNAECNKGRTADYIGSLGEIPNPMRQFRVSTHPFYSASMASSSEESSILLGSTSLRMGNNS